MRQINVLSLFDGMSCGQIALERAEIKVNRYYASEIDKYAIKVTQSHYPDTIQLGDVQKWENWELPKIDLLIGGSPCQGFSNAGHGLNFDDPRSKLFFTYVSILKHLKSKNPDLLFLLENVKMKKAWQDIITCELGVEPVEIDSALVSAQSRRRLYWTNFPIIKPADKGIVLADIIEYGEVDREKSYTIDANYYKGGNPRSYFVDGRRQLVFEHESHRRAMVKVRGAAIRNQVTKKGVEEQLNIRKDEKSNCVVPTYPNRLNGVVTIPEATRQGYVNIHPNEGADLTALGSKTRRGRRMSSKSNALMKSSKFYWNDGYEFRKLTVIECERLQTVPDNWTSMVSNTQRYKMLGNGWTIDVIKHIFEQMPL